jgi:glutamate-1-semialdehyde 2,1-aminomutase
MAAGIATLAELEPERYAALEARVDRLVAGLESAIADAGREAVVSHAGPLLTLFFRPTVPRDGTEALASDREAYAVFFSAMLDRGILLPPSQFEAWFPGFAHGDAEVDLVLEAARAALAA